MVWFRRWFGSLFRPDADRFEKRESPHQKIHETGPRLVHSDGSAADRREPVKLGHLSRAQGDFSSYSRSQQAAIAEHLGDEALRAGRATEAAAKYYAAVRLWPVFQNTQKAAEAFLEAGDLEMALHLAENQVERSRRETGHQTEETADAHGSLARVQVACSDFSGAEVSARAALRIDRVTGRDKGASHARHLLTLGLVQTARGRLDEAGEALDRALSLTRKAS